MLSFSLSINLLLKTRVVFLHLFKFVALVISSCRWSMLAPFTHANPTKVVFTELASHVVTTLIFFNRSFTAWTWFCVCHNPRYVLTFCLAFDVPFLCCLTITRLVRTFIACKAEVYTTNAVDFHIRSKDFSFEAIFTAEFWTPFDRTIVVSIRFTQPLPVGLLVSWTCAQYFFKDGVSHLHIAANLHARGVYSLWSTLNFLNQVTSPAVSTKRVPTDRKASCRERV